MLQAASFLRRSLVELEPDALLVTFSEGRTRRVELSSARVDVGDATLLGRFVRHLRIERPGDESTDLVTPPEEGSIAPRAARLPRIDVTPELHIVSGVEFTGICEWLRADRRLSGRTISELAIIARLATPFYAMEIGEKAAQLAGDLMARGRFAGPLRGAGELDPRRLLRPLEDAALESSSANEAFVAALARVATLLG